MASKKKGGKSSAKKKSVSGKLIAAVAILVLIVVIALFVTYLIKPDIIAGLFTKVEDAYKQYVSMYYNDSEDDDPAGTNGAIVAPTPEGDLAEISESGLSIHFLELGNAYAGDCTLIKVGDTEVLIDAGSRQSSATTIKSYVDQYCTDGMLEYVIATHAHQDHIAGFVGNASGGTRTGILYQYGVGTLIQFSGHNTTSNIYKNYVSAAEYAASNGADVYTAKQCWYETDGARKQYVLDEAGNVTLNVLYNVYYDQTTSDENDYSVCVLISQKLENGSTNHYLFTGDLEGEGEKGLVENNDLPKVVLFKGGHHGSKTSTTEKLLEKIRPDYVAVCCCAGSTEYTTNNDNTFPTQDFITRVSKYTDKIYVTSLCLDYAKREFTSMNGDIVFYYDASSAEVKLWCSNNTTLLKDTEWFKANRVWG